MIVIAILMFAMANEDFLNMVQERTDKGHTWHYVGRTQVDDKWIALPATEQDGTDVFYWEIKE